MGRATSTSDFRIADLMNLDHPVSLYLVVPPSDLSRLRRAHSPGPQPGRAAPDGADGIRAGYRGQEGRHSSRRSARRSPQAGRTRRDGRRRRRRIAGYRHRLLLLVDEFTSLGKLDFFENQLAFCAGYGLKCFMVAQSLNQLQKTYGEKNSILDNSHIRVTYAANDEITARRISDLVGQATLTKRQRSFSAAKLLGGRSVSESEQEFARPLLTADEVLRLPYDEAILLVSGMAPYRGKKLMYYLDPRFSAPGGPAPTGQPARAASPAPPPVGRGIRMGGLGLDCRARSPTTTAGRLPKSPHRVRCRPQSRR